MSPGGSGGRVLVVNADDLGRTPGINDGIFEAHEGGIVTSATLMVNYPASAEAGRRLAEHPRLGVGLHVALTGGPPTLPPARLPSLVDAAGGLPPKPEGLTAPDAGEVLAEVRAQLGRFRELTGRLPTHLDSHHHSHRLPVVCAALEVVAREIGVPVRRASEEVAARLRQAGVRTTDSFDAGFFGEATGVEDLVSLLAELPTGSTELMCHPARVDEELRRGSSYAEERRRELETLTHPRVRRAVEELGVRLAHFADFAGPPA